MTRAGDITRKRGVAGRKGKLAVSLALAAVLAALQLAAADSRPPGPKSAGVRLAPADALPVTGRWLVRDDINLVSLDAEERALLVWDNLSIGAEDVAYLSLSIEGLPTHLDAKIVWRTSARSEPGVLVLPRHPANHPTVSLRAHKRWRGTVSLVGIVVEDAFGLPGTTKSIPRITFGAPRLQPTSLAAASGAQLTAWISPRLYDGSSVNTAGSPTIPGTLPLLYVGYAFALLALLIGVIVGWWKRRDSRTLLSWAAAGILGAHLIASFPIWRDLAANLVDAHRNYSGRADPLSGLPEAYLYDLALRTRNSIDDRNARIFIASDNQFTRQRMNYFLAPLNAAPVFEASFRLTRTEPPAAQGDYVLVFPDAGVDWTAAERVLSTPWHAYSAARLWRTPHASLFRVTGVNR